MDDLISMARSLSALQTKANIIFLKFVLLLALIKTKIN